MLVLVRHGRTAYNHQRRFLGRSDIPLDDVGQGEARSLAGWLSGFDDVYTSPLLRAAQTARHLHPSPRPVEALQELAHGELEGLPADEALARYPDFFEVFAREPEVACVPGGEALGACQARALDALRAIAAQHRGGVAAVVTHQMVIASVACAAAGDPLTRWRHHGIRNAAVTVLSVRGSSFEIARENLRFDDPV